MLTDRYATRSRGVLLCFDRLLITGTLPDICHADAFTRELHLRHVRIFDHTQFARTREIALGRAIRLSDGSLRYAPICQPNPPRPHPAETMPRRSLPTHLIGRWRKAATLYGYRILDHHSFPPLRFWRQPIFLLLTGATPHESPALPQGRAGPRRALYALGHRSLPSSFCATGRARQCTSGVHGLSPP